VEADAVVIGAGAAGLAAARSLARRSVRVVVLEARDRVGGRAWSQSIPGIVTPAELGAEFIHGRAELTMRLLREAGMAAIDTGGEGWVCAPGGELRHEADDFLSAAGIFEAAHELPADESVETFLRRFERNEATRQTARTAAALVEGFDAAEPAIAGVRGIADEWQSGVDFAIARPLLGYRPMFQYLHDTCTGAGVQIHFSTIVRRVAWRRGSVVVEAVCGGEPRTVRARTAIVTLSTGVLRHRGTDGAVAFDPSLPAAKLMALERIEMGHVVKVTLSFATAFWEGLDDGRYRDGGFFRCEGRSFPAYWTQLPVRSTLVVAWAGGPKAIALDGMAQDRRIQRAAEGFGEMFNEPDVARKAFAGGLTHDWARDPFARGAYSYLAVGAAGAREALGAPVEDTLFFAGEATALHGESGTVNGALETGERAAAEAAEALGAPRGGPR
jgi:monoamine oxidase